MKAIELNSKTDKAGHLKIDYKLEKSNSNVRVIILVEDNADGEEKLWMDTVSANPSFEFLKEPSEDIYSMNDGVPFND